MDSLAYVDDKNRMGNLRLIAFLLTLGFFSIIVAGSSADLIWDSGFESSPDDDWNHIYELGSITYTGSIAHSGSRCSDHHVPPDGSFIISRGRAQIDSYIGERQIRLWINVDEFVIPEGTETAVLRDTGSGCQVFLRNTESGYEFVFEAVSGLWSEYSEAAPIDKAEWHQIDMYLRTESSLGAQDGIARWWLDGTQHYSRADCGEFPATHSWVMGIAGPIFGDATEYGHIYVDDVKAYNSLKSPTEHTLEVSSTMGGEVTAPGEGVFEYDNGEPADLEATSDADYEFTEWSGTGVDAGKVSDPFNPVTMISVDDDYTVAADFVLIDSDNDGMRDSWEQQIVDDDPNDEIMTVEDVLPEDDYDDDGTPNSTEEAAGTDPTDSASYFAIAGIRKTLVPLEVTITWTSVVGMYYAIYYSDDEPGSEMTWTIAQDMIPGTGTGTNEWTDDGSLTTPIPDDEDLHGRQYRVIVHPD